MGTLPDRLMVRNGTFYFRLWIPQDILPLIGRRLVVKSLRTKDLKTAKARLARKTVEAEDMFEAVRSRGATAADTNSLDEAGEPVDLDAVIAAHVRVVQDREFELRHRLYEDAVRDPKRLWSGELVPLPVSTNEAGSSSYTFFDHLVAEGDLDRVIGYLHRMRIQAQIKDLKRQRAVGDLSPMLAVAHQGAPGLSASGALRLTRRLIDAEIETLEALQENAPVLALSESHRLVPSHEPDTMVSRPPMQDTPEAHAVSLSDVFARWEAETQPSASTLSSWRGILRDLQSFLGAKADDIQNITSTDLIKWKDKLVKDGKAAATISRGYLGCARALFRFAMSNHLIVEDPSQGIKVVRKSKAGTRMLAYSNDEVRRLLSLARSASEPWKKWLPLLAAATGSRIGEVAQLHGSHVTMEEGLHVIKIRPAHDAGTIKNEGSERTIPIHPALISEGFLKFVEDRGSGPLFYRRSSGDPKRKHASKGVSNRLAAWIRANGFDDPRKAPNHALRHWFKTEASRVGIPDSIADAIQGHSDGKASSVYRHVSVAAMAKELEKISL